MAIKMTASLPSNVFTAVFSFPDGAHAEEDASSKLARREARAANSAVKTAIWASNLAKNDRHKLFLQPFLAAQIEARAVSCPKGGASNEVPRVANSPAS